MPQPSKPQDVRATGLREPDLSPPARTTGFAYWVATGLGFGLSPIVPGTVGALWGIPLAFTIALIPNLWLQAAVIVALFAISVPISTVAAHRLGRGKDPGAIVIDEIVSLPVVYFGFGLSPAVVLAGFVLHRLFDITKPPPARQLERLPEGLGIMADDMAAALYAQLALRLVAWLGWLGG